MSLSVLSFFSQSMVAASVILLIFLFFKNIYGCKYKKKRYYFIGYFITLVLMVTVNRLELPYINGLFSFTSMNIICVILFETNIKKVWFHNLLFWFLLCFCDVITLVVWSAVGDKSLVGVLFDYQLMLGSNILNIIFMYVSYRVYLTIMQKIKFQEIHLKIAFFLITMTFFEIWVVVTYIFQITDRNGGIRMIIMLIGFLLLNIFLAYILSQISEAYRYKNELTLSKQLCEIHMKNYMEISHKYEEARAVIHDKKKHLMVADKLKAVDQDTYSEYISEMYRRMDELFCCFHCSSSILSAILSQKISYAKSKGISVDIDFDEVPMDFIDNYDITAIFTNIWDNAIEACEKVKEKKFINMTIRRFNDFLIVNLENSFDGVILPKNEFYTSTKNGHDGVGLKSVKMSVERYDGTFLTFYNDTVFKAEITIPINQ